MSLKNIIRALIIIGLSLPVFSYGQGPAAAERRLIVFQSLTCHKCAQVKKEIMPDIEKEFSGRIQIDYRDIGDIENYKLLLNLREKHNPRLEIKVPVFFFEGKFLTAKKDLKRELKNLIEESLKKDSVKEHLPQVDLVGYFKTFKPLAVIGAGLADGINPCAFTVIVFFISFLALQGYRKRELVLVGLVFIAAVFLTYLLLGLGIFNFLYKLKGVWAAIKMVNISVGILSIILGIFALYDFYKYKKTRQTDGLLLQLPQPVKKKIHFIIGLYYRKPRDSDIKTEEPKIGRLVLVTFATGFLISLLEAVCTGQLYLPTIILVLKTAEVKLQALAYLLLYNLMFVVPLFVIFFLALLGTTSGEFSGFFRKHLPAVKIIMAAVFFALGILLIWRA